MCNFCKGIIKGEKYYQAFDEKFITITSSDDTERDIATVWDMIRDFDTDKPIITVGEYAVGDREEDNTAEMYGLINYKTRINYCPLCGEKLDNEGYMPEGIRLFED